ncbi:MAG: poly(ADP-ribose) glycohydrolase domain-containing protein [Planctomycetota bacterium]
MPARRLLRDADLAHPPFDEPVMVRRRAVLRETLAALGDERRRRSLERAADENHRRWAQRRGAGPAECEVRVVAGDWGDVTRALSEEFGAVFAALNMANAHVAGSGYVEGMAAQEENMFRRTDCHLAVERDPLVGADGRYTREGSALVSGRDGRVHLDVGRPRVCIRGSEDRAREDLGYPFLDDSEVFRFYEVRAAAQDQRGTSRFDVAEAARRIAALLDTLVAAEVRHAVLGALGCGAFENPARVVAGLFREAIDARRDRFDVVAFAVHSAGYGPGNLRPFEDAFR